MAESYLDWSDKQPEQSQWKFIAIILVIGILLVGVYLGVSTFMGESGEQIDSDSDLDKVEGEVGDITKAISEDLSDIEDVVS